MKVSVLIKAYNHERYIAQAIESALAQQTSFPFEIVVGEDASTDQTRSLALALAERHPEKIRVLMRPGNLGNMRNLLDTFQACRGEYIAWLDGDDYWVSMEKLERQVAVLETHPRYVISATNSVIVDESGQVVQPRFKRPGKRVFRFRQILRRGRVPTSSLLIRRRVFEQLPPWFLEFAVADWPLQILALQEGDMHYDGETLSALRTHSRGLWASANIEQRHRIQLQMYRILEQHLPRYRHLIRARVARELLCLAAICQQAGENEQLRPMLSEALQNGWRSPSVWVRLGVLYLQMLR